MTVDGSNYDNRGSSDRYGNWMQTYSGRQFWPLDARPEEIEIVDIATALSRACRFAGHCESFYSVAEHSVLVSLVVPSVDRFAALMHDATEAYLVDIPRPIKPYLVGYKEIEDRLWGVIAERFGIDPVLPASVKEADNTVLLAEQAQIMKPPPADWAVPGEPAAVGIRCLSPDQAYEAFMARFNYLTRTP